MYITLEYEAIPLEHVSYRDVAGERQHMRQSIWNQWLTIQTTTLAMHLIAVWHRFHEIVAPREARSVFLFFFSFLFFYAFFFLLLH